VNLISPLKRPLISVVTASWNCANTIEDCLKSVASQSWVDRARVVIDGGSKDGTLLLLDLHRQQISTRISEPEKGI
jgi:glycosyltransferase